MHCHSDEKLSSFGPFMALSNLPLPWPEDEFESGLAKGASATLTSTKSNGGIYAELVKAMTLW